MKARNIRVIAASFLLFQHALMPPVVYAIENEMADTTEQVEEQPESYITEAEPEAEVEPPLVQEETPQEEPVEPSSPETPGIVEEALGVEEEQPVVPEELPEESTEISELPPLDENPLSNHLGRLHLTPSNVEQLTNHGRISYLEGVLQNAINRNITLANTVNATATFSVTVPTHSMVQRVNGSNGWISSIVTDSPAGMPDEFYTQMYYGNHSTHRNTYTLSGISSNRSDVTVSGNVTINSNFTATINFTVRRVQTSNSTAPVIVRANVGLGTTGVATQFTHIATPRRVMDLSYNTGTIGTLALDDGRSSAVIGRDITLQAQRAPITMSEEEIRSWFTRLPDNPDNYEYSVASPAEGWRPDTTGNMVVTLRNKTTSVTETHTTNYRVVDTQAPIARVRPYANTDIQARRSGGSAAIDRANLALALSELSDNWTLREDIDITFRLLGPLGGTIMSTFTGIAPDPSRTYTGRLTFEDEAGNISGPVGGGGSENLVTYRVVDTQAPTANFSNAVVDLAARRSGNPSRNELMPFLNGNPEDNWSLPANIQLHLVNSDGSTLNLSEITPSSDIQTGYLRLQDAAGNRSPLQEVRFRVFDNEAPTANVRTDVVGLEARREGELSDEELLSFFTGGPWDNWSLPENINVEVLDSANEKLTITNRPPSTTEHSVTIRLTDEAGNTREYSARYRVVDTQAPTATFNEEIIDFSTHASNSFSRDDLLRFLTGDPSDNWSLPPDINIELVDENEDEFNLNDLDFEEHTGYLYLEDEAGNRSSGQEVKFLAGDNEGPTGNVVTTPVDFQARRVNELTRADLLRFFTEDPLDNVTASDQIELSLRNNLGDVVSIVNVAPSTTVYDANVRLQDARGNQTEYPVNYRVIDTQAPTGNARGTWTVFEATRERDFTQAELRSLISNLADNWTELANIQLENHRNLYNLSPSSSNSFHPVDITATDEAGNSRRIANGMVRVVDTTAPTGTLKDPLVFTKGQTAPAPRDFLDGEPTDNWTLTQNIQVTVAYENNVSFADLEVGTYGVTVTLRDQAGNVQTLNSQVTILEDTSEYIDVTIPMNVSFAQSKESEGIVSPTYQIQNNAERPVTVSVTSMVSQANTGRLTEIDLGLKNNLNDQQVMLISSGQNLNNRRELGTIEGRHTSFSFSLFGNVGENFDFGSLDDPLHPIYSMRWNFNAQ